MYKIASLGKRAFNKMPFSLEGHRLTWNQWGCLHLLKDQLNQWH